MKTRQEIEERIAHCLYRKDIMESYLKMKIADEDWHGVEDSASDIRDIEAELVSLRWVLGE